MTSHLDDVPPPPYSETDIYSNLGAANHRTSSRDDASSATSNGEVIYTPPLTPHSSHTQQNFASEADRLTTVSAEAYFESRPAPALLLSPAASAPAGTQQGQQQLTHSIRVGPRSSPGDLPYPGDLLARRDVRVEDWQTFVNYLIPHYSAESNESLVDRKLRAEGIDSSPKAADGGEARSPVEAQLDQIRSPAEAAQRRQNLEDTVREWNDGFFGPRGVVILLEQQQQPYAGAETPRGEPAMPGGWDQSFDGADAAGQQQPTGGSRFRRFNPFGGGNAGGPNGAASRGWRFAGITIDGDRVAFGDNVVADRSGVRIGRFVADNEGVRLGGSTLFPGPGAGPTGHVSRGWPVNSTPSAPPAPPGQSAPPAPPAPPAPYGYTPAQAECGIDEPHRHDKNGRCMGTRRDSGGGRWGGGRGRHGHRGEGRRARSASTSSSGSSSSSSSSSDASSVGSLPDWDDLRDQQLPVARQRLQEWLDHPDMIITRDSVREAREQIKAAKKEANAAAAAARGPGRGSPAIAEPLDRAALRSQVKAMMGQWKALKKQQRQLRRQLKRQKKAHRRAEHRERRQVRREMRRSKREVRREGRRGGGECGRGGRGPWWRGGQPPQPPLGAPWSPLHGQHPMFGPGHGPPGHHFGPGQQPPRGFAENMQDFGERMGAWGRDVGQAGAEYGDRMGAWGTGFGRSFTGGPGGGRWWRDGRHQPPPHHGDDKFPGTWPSDAEDAGGDAAHHAASRAKYQAVQSLHGELDQKKAELARLKEQQRVQAEQERIQAEQQQQQQQKGEEGKPVGVEDTNRSGHETEGTVRGLELELQALEKTVEKLNLEADEEYARELAQEEERSQQTA
ncbi:hypothetical protein NKR23_g950 [Pleurostoma richardsiae]|uniref:RING finger domain-containing protein n=1 Tax=Pleurostoma richardsiae TaxID=41990 RepID=A0AA38SBF9_9PEZI|nr:hypothetical protein NKR23_g950 [Pleurostoma richardsiae]